MSPGAVRPLVTPLGKDDCNDIFIHFRSAYFDFNHMFTLHVLMTLLNVNSTSLVTILTNVMVPVSLSCLGRRTSTALGR